MIDKIFKTPATRFDLIFQLSIIALAGFALTRCVFLIRPWQDEAGLIKWGKTIPG